MYSLSSCTSSDRLPAGQMRNRSDDRPTTIGPCRLSVCVCVEIFCGKARLSKFLRRKGFQVFSVDHKALKDKALKGVPILMIDINSPSQKRVLEELLRRDAIIYVHFAPHAAHAVLQEISGFQRTNMVLHLFVHYSVLWAFSIWKEFKNCEWRQQTASMSGQLR